MRFVIIVRTAADPGGRGWAATQLVDGVCEYQDQLAQAGVLLDASAHDVAGYAVVQVRSREEADQWSRRFPDHVRGGMPVEVEVLRLAEPGDQ